MTALQIPNNDVTGSRIDPVCGMQVGPARKNLVALYDGRSFWFCADACLSAFESSPRKYMERTAPKRKGWFGRYLERLARVNEKEFGGGALKCH